MKSKLIIVLAFLGFISLTSCKRICKIFCGDCTSTAQCNPPPDKKTYLDSQVIAYNPSPALVHFLDSIGYHKKDSCNCKDSMELWVGNQSAETVIGLIGKDCKDCINPVGDLTAVESVGYNFILDFKKDSIRIPIGKRDTPVVKILGGNSSKLKPRSYPGDFDLGIVDSGEGDIVGFLNGKRSIINPADPNCFPNSGQFGLNLTTPDRSGEPVDKWGHGNAVNCISLGYGQPPSYSNLKVINSKFINSPTDTGNLFKALCASYFALEHGAKILNFSWGFKGSKAQMPKTMIPFLRKAVEKNVLIVAGAGNDGINLDTAAFWPASFNTLYPNIIAVGGLNELKTEIWTGSNFGSTIDIYAQAQNVRFPYFLNGIETSGDGTSFAAPRIVYELAAIMNDDPTINIYDAKRILLTKRTLPINSKGLAVLKLK